MVFHSFNMLLPLFSAKTPTIKEPGDGEETD